jgi:hypothetical protein
MLRRGVCIGLIAILAMATAVVSGCGPDPKEEYTKQTVAIVDEWQVIIDRWNASPGDSAVVTDFVVLQARAGAIEPPKGMEDLHELFLKAMEAETLSFELYALGKKEESSSLHEQALDAMERFTQEMKDLGLLK